MLGTINWDPAVILAWSARSGKSVFQGRLHHDCGLLVASVAFPLFFDP